MDFPQPYTHANRGVARSPVVISIPHAGRSYPTALAVMLRAPVNRLVSLEDRYADVLANDSIQAGFEVITAQVPRLWIDLNRAVSDVDPEMIEPPFLQSGPLSQKVRGGLGLIPRHLAGLGNIWQEPLTHGALAARINGVHRPYHAALTSALDAARRHFGCAILIDLHTMPPLKTASPADVVIGDRFGRSADARLTDVARVVFERAGLRVGLNTPYPGGFIIEHHAAPGRSVYGIQIELDRRLYLDGDLLQPTVGVLPMQQVVRKLAESLAAELQRAPLAEAAE